MATGYVVPERPDWTRARLAPAGDRFAAVRWHDGAANVWVGSSDAPMQLASDLRPWRLCDYVWSADGHALILVIEVGGGPRVLVWLDLRTQAVSRLSPGLGADARYAGQSDSSRPGVLVAIRHPYTSSFRLQLLTPAGAVRREWRAPAEHAAQWLASDRQAVAVCMADDLGAESASSRRADPDHVVQPDAVLRGCTWWYSQLAEPAWSPVCEIPAEDARASRPLAFSADGKTLFALSSAGRDTLALVAMAPPTWTPEVVSASPEYDVAAVLMAPDGARPDLVTTTNPLRPQVALSAAAAADLSRLEDLADGAQARIIGRNASHCLAEISYPVGGPAFVTFARSGGGASRPLARFTAFARRRIQCRDPLAFRARDSRLLTGFLTRPAGSPPWPVVLAIHDGPWARDLPQIDPWAQHLAAAGYCCVQVNYRGSRGFGKAFADAANRQWSLAMQDDLVDALRSEQVAAVADPRRIAAVGYGYGGYAALMLGTQAEAPLAAVAAAAAPTDLVRYVNGLLAFGGAAGFAEAARIGDPHRDHDQLVRASPVFRAADLRVPVLLVHGRQDARVPVIHATALADGIGLAGGRCELTIYEDEGHRFARPQNLSDLRKRTLTFLRAALSDTAASAADRQT
jgi:dipeptidyl aminopeptidase/acylaminoacyl peptidase